MSKTVRTQFGKFTVAQGTIERGDEGNEVRLETRKGKVVVTTMTDEESIQSLSQMFIDGKVRGDFPGSLISGHSKSGLSREQWIWVHLLVTENLTHEERVEEVKSVDLVKTVEYFTKATEGLKFPKVRLELDDTVEGGSRPVVLGRAGDRSKFPGSINITDGGPFGDNVWYGRIMTDGTLSPSRSCDDLVINLLKEFNENPSEVASLYGIKTGNCCFCRKELSTKESLSVGYGPVCADHWGLPWGHVSEEVTVQSTESTESIEWPGDIE